MNRIVVVGASLAGLRAVETLRREKFEGELVLVGDEAHPPYDRPPLSKELLRGDWEAEKLALRRKPYEELELDLRLGVAAEALDVEGKTLRLADGSELGFDGLIIATGARARALPFGQDLEGVRLLRSLDDALALREAFGKQPRVAVVGAGFIGAEVAASARKLGLDVVMIEPEPVPMRRGLGLRMGQVMADIHRAEGVDLRCGVGVEGFEGDARVEAVRLSDGSTLAADEVIVGVGATPNTEWLESSALEIDNGVVCDAQCVAAPDIVAAGDVARWHNPRFDETMRVEHWTNAVEQSVYAARRLLAGQPLETDFDPVPMVWTDQYDVKLQFAGRVAKDAEFEIIEGTPEDRKLVALTETDGKLTGVLTLNNPRKLIGFRQKIAEGVSYEDAKQGE